MSLWQPTIEMNLKISVVLLGLNNDFPSEDDSSLVVDSESLRTTLEELLSLYLTPMMHTASSASRAEEAGASDQLNHRHGGRVSPFRARYDISYHVSHARKNMHNEYLEVLANAAEVDTAGEDGAFRPLLVPIDAVSQALEKMASYLSGVASSPTEHAFGDSEVTVLVANPSRSGLVTRLRSRGKLNPTAGVDSGREGEYAFAEPGSLHRAARRKGEAKEGSNGTGSSDRRSSCARCWVGQGRVLILDLGAAACRYGALGEDGPRSTVTETMFPSVSLKGDSGYWLDPSEQDRQGAPGKLVREKDIYVGGRRRGRYPPQGSTLSLLKKLRIMPIRLLSMILAAAHSSGAHVIGTIDTHQLLTEPWECLSFQISALPNVATKCCSCTKLQPQRTTKSPTSTIYEAYRPPVLPSTLLGYCVDWFTFEHYLLHAKALRAPYFFYYWTAPSEDNTR